ncbi:MAG TPA: DUF1003 domain-containing protein [Patescibacteria group bacterium]
MTKVKEIKAKHERKLGLLDSMALFITNKVGTMGFFFLIFIWTVGWLGWNTLGPQSLRFDPFPGFVLWLFISNMLQIFLMPLLLIGQNLQGQAAEKRTEYDFEVDQKAESEIEAIVVHLERQQKLLEEIAADLKK